MKNQGKGSPPNSHHNSLASEFKDNKLIKMLENEFRSPLFKMVRDLKKDSDKQINEVRKSIQDLDKKISTVEKKFSKEMEIMKKY
jgi:DNA primase large subunit